MKAFYDILKSELQKINFEPKRLFSVDESGIMIVQHKSVEILSMKGKKQIHKLSTLEHGKLVTVVTSMSAFRRFLPPMLIFPHKCLTENFKNELPVGVLAVYHKSG